MKDKNTKHAEAIARNAAWAKLTPAQKLESLDKQSLVATKQRAKLAKLMES